MAEQIKLVIWDLDDTLWNGTLAEGGVPEIPDGNIRAVKTLTERGIVNSICSKNNFDAARLELEKSGVWDYFVFPHIAFTPKGEAIRNIIENMGLRPGNVLFADDNQTNLEEARFYNPGLQTLHAKDLPGLLSVPGAAGKPDPGHKRLNQYKMMEARHTAKSETDGNDLFLKESDIHVAIVTSTIKDAPRVHDMIMRTNQLNFTKKRITEAELTELLGDASAQCGSVYMRDRFGDHGLVGWYCLKDGELPHFLFSCRVINLGVEQYVYTLLGCPKLTTEGDTASSVSPGQTIDYITLDDAPAEENPPAAVPSSAGPEKLRIFAVGACDLYYLVSHMALPLTDVKFECNTFNGNFRGVNVSTEYLRSCFEMNEDEKNLCRLDFHNYSGSTAFRTEIFAETYDFVCLSFHDDFALEIYESNNNPNMRVVLSNSKSGTFTPILNSGGAKWLAENFTRRGFISPERFRENLEWIESRLPKETRMILMTGPEFDYFRESEPHNPVFRNLVFELNAVIRDFCAARRRCSVVEMNEFIFSREHFTNFIMHLSPKRGHLLALRMLEEMAERKSLRELRKTLPVSSRRLALWCDVPQIYPNYLTLCALNAKPDDIVALQSETDVIKSIPPEALAGKSDAYFVLLAPSEKAGERKNFLLKAGFAEHTGFAVLEPARFVPEWREN